MVPAFTFRYRIYYYYFGMQQDGVKGPLPASPASPYPRPHTAIQLFRHYLLKILSSPHWINLVPFSKINGVVYFWTFILFHWCVFYSYNLVLFYLIILLICFLFPPMIYALFGGLLLNFQPFWGLLDVTILLVHAILVENMFCMSQPFEITQTCFRGPSLLCLGKCSGCPWTPQRLVVLRECFMFL